MGPNWKLVFYNFDGTKGGKTGQHDYVCPPGVILCHVFNLVLLQTNLVLNTVNQSYTLLYLYHIYVI